MPQYAKAQSWDKLERFYLDLVDHGWRVERVVDLIKHIRSSEFSNRLFAYTSLSTLCVSICDPIEWNVETLRIEFDGENDCWNFTYYSTPYQKPTFVRQYPANSGIDKFNSFIKMVRW